MNILSRALLITSAIALSSIALADASILFAPQPEAAAQTKNSAKRAAPTVSASGGLAKLRNAAASGEVADLRELAYYLLTHSSPATEARSEGFGLLIRTAATA